MNFFDFNDTLLKNSEHVSNETDVLLSDIKSSKICKGRFEGTFIILKNSLVRDFKVFADYGRCRFFFHREERWVLIKSVSLIILLGKIIS